MTMRAKVLGSLLILLGVVSYVASGGASVTAMIPAFFGVPILLLGWMAHKGIAKQPLLWICVVLAIVGLLGAARGVVQLPTLLDGSAERPLAIIAQTLMAVFCLLFVVTGVPALLKK